MKKNHKTAHPDDRKKHSQSAQHGLTVALITGAAFFGVVAQTSTSASAEQKSASAPATSVTSFQHAFGTPSTGDDDKGDVAPEAVTGEQMDAYTEQDKNHLPVYYGASEHIYYVDYASGQVVGEKTYFGVDGSQMPASAVQDVPGGYEFDPDRPSVFNAVMTGGHAHTSMFAVKKVATPDNGDPVPGQSGSQNDSTFTQPVDNQAPTDDNGGATTTDDADNQPELPDTGTFGQSTDASAGNTAQPQLPDTGDFAEQTSRATASASSRQGARVIATGQRATRRGPDAHTLPQTGDQHNAVLGALGLALASVMSVLGIAKLRKTN